MLAFISKPSSQLIVAIVHFAMICYTDIWIVHVIAGASLFLCGLNIGSYKREEITNE